MSQFSKAPAHTITPQKNKYFHTPDQISCSPGSWANTSVVKSETIIISDKYSDKILILLYV